MKKGKILGATLLMVLFMISNCSTIDSCADKNETGLCILITEDTQFKTYAESRICNDQAIINYGFGNVTFYEVDPEDIDNMGGRLKAECDGKYYVY